MSVWQQLRTFSSRFKLASHVHTMPRRPVLWHEELEPLPVCRTVLVVDDDPPMLGLIVKILSEENYEILAASSGDEALQILDVTGIRIDLLITDYAMPGITGRELADRVRARFPYVKVLHQTGFSDLLFKDRIEIEPNAAFIEKPFTARGLLEAARLVLFNTIHPRDDHRAA